MLCLFLVQSLCSSSPSVRVAEMTLGRRFHSEAVLGIPRYSTGMEEDMVLGLFLVQSLWFSGQK